MRARRLTAVAGLCGAIAAGGIALAGCGASSTLDPVAQAADVTAQLPGAQVSITETLSGAGLPAGTTFTATGYVNQHSRATLLHADLSSLPGLSQLGAGAGKATIEIVYPDLYETVPAFAGKLPDGKTWIKLDVAQIAASQGVSSSAFSSGGLDPSEFLSFLRASGSTLTKLGTETINGVPTTRYHTVVQFSQIPQAMPASERSSMSAAVASLEKATGASSLPIDVWIDSQHRVRREQFSLNITSQGKTLGLAAQVNYVGFGPTAAIVPPPANSVYDLTPTVLAEASGSGA